MDSESIDLVATSEIEIERLASVISATEPQYSLFRYRIKLEDTEKTPLIFIYTCPSGLKVKERMLYSLMKQGFLSAVNSDFGLEVSKKVDLTFLTRLQCSPF